MKDNASVAEFKKKKKKSDSWSDSWTVKSCVCDAINVQFYYMFYLNNNKLRSWYFLVLKYDYRCWLKHFMTHFGLFKDTLQQ